MNSEQLKSLIRTGLGTAGGAIIGWFASKGWHLSPDDQKSVIALLQSPELIGLIVSGLTAVLGLVTHTQSNAVAVVAKIAADPDSPIVGVVTTNDAAGRAVANAHGAEVSVASTPAATAIAQDNVPPLTQKAA